MKKTIIVKNVDQRVQEVLQVPLDLVVVQLALAAQPDPLDSTAKKANKVQLDPQDPPVQLDLAVQQDPQDLAVKQDLAVQLALQDPQVQAAYLVPLISSP
jgi:hypothetical protein